MPRTVRTQDQWAGDRRVRAENATPNRRLRAARERRGLTLEQVAELVADQVERRTLKRPPIDGDHIGKYERGLHTWPGKDYRHAFRQIFGVETDAELGFYSRQHASAPVDRAAFTVGEGITPVDRRQFISGLTGVALFADLAAGTRIGGEHVQEFRRVQRTLEQRDTLVGGDHLYESGVLQLQRLSQVINYCTYSDSTGRDLRAVAGELAVTTGWLAFDADQQAAAWYYYNEGLTSARLARDTEVEVWAFEKLSRLAAEAMRPRDAIELAQEGQRYRVTARCLSFLNLREALGWAILKDRAACGTALASAQRLFDRGASHDDPIWLGFYDEAELCGLAARCQSFLGEFDDAKTLSGSALSHLRPEYTRNRVLIILGLAEACAAKGEPEEAAAAGLDALALCEQVTSTRATTRLDILHRRLVRAYGSIAMVKDFSERLQASA